MPNLPISQLSQSTALQGDELLVNVQGGVTKKQTVQDILSANLPLTSSGIILSGDIVPATPQGATLGSIDRPFADLFIQSGSISIESDTPGDPSAIISNEGGNLEISVGGMTLIESGSSFTAPTGSFEQLSAGLQEGYMWVGDSANTNTAIPTGSFVQTSQTGSYVITASLEDHLMTFTKADTSTFNILLPGGQGSPSTNHYLIPEFITVNGTSSEPYPHFYLTGSTYEDTAMVKVDWTGSNGTAHIVLPDATTDTNRYRALRLIMGAGFDSNTKGILFADVDNLGQTLDGSSGGYTLSKPYEGIMVWSDGSNWIRIQTKA